MSSSGRTMKLRALLGFAMVLASIGVVSSSGSVSATSAGPIALLGVSSIQIAIQKGMSIQKLPSNLAPQLSGEAKSMFWGGACIIGEPGSSSTAKACPFGDLSATSTVVVYGDSFSVEWVPAFNALGIKYHFKVLLFSRNGCPFADVKINDWIGSVDSGCLPFRQHVVEAINAMRPLPSLVVLSEETDLSSPKGGVLSMVQWTNGIKKTILQLDQATFPIDVIFGEPEASSPPSACLARFSSSITKCSSRSSAALRNYNYPQIASAVSSVHAGLVNTSSLFCFDEICPDVISGTLVHSDNWHIDQTFAAMATQGLASLIGCTVNQFNKLTATSRLLLQSLLPGANSAGAKGACATSVTANHI